MEAIIGLMILAVGLAILAALGYLGWKLFISFFKGIRVAGRIIDKDGPAFLGRVIYSVGIGFVAGIIIGILTGGNITIGSASGVGVAVVHFIKESISS